MPRDDPVRRRPAGALRWLAVCAALLIVVFVVLGTWQVKRLQWKLDLIHKVDTRVHARPAPAPGPSAWPRVNAAEHEYRHVVLTGVYLTEYTSKVQALSELGAGFWLLTPLCRDDGSVVMVNRGFVAPGVAEKIAPSGQAAGTLAPACAAARAAAAPVTVTGLLRIAEPGGAFLRKNDPAAHRWFSRDVAGIAAAYGLGPVAPYFVDAGRKQEQREAPAGEDAPTGGLTVISFQNNHLVYALTWYALALMTAGAAWWVARDERRRRDNASAG